MLLGHHLKALEFTGPIYASPYRRTMETACGVAEIVDTTVHPAPAMREIVKRVEQMEHFVGLTTLELGQLHPRVETSPLMKIFRTVLATVARSLRRSPRGRRCR